LSATEFEAARIIFKASVDAAPAVACMEPRNCHLVYSPVGLGLVRPAVLDCRAVRTTCLQVSGPFGGELDHLRFTALAVIPGHVADVRV
jgi:hypothetical protein